MSSRSIRRDYVSKCFFYENPSQPKACVPCYPQGKVFTICFIRVYPFSSRLFRVKSLFSVSSVVKKAYPIKNPARGRSGSSGTANERFSTSASIFSSEIPNGKKTVPAARSSSTR